VVIVQLAGIYQIKRKSPMILFYFLLHIKLKYLLHKIMIKLFIVILAMDQCLDIMGIISIMMFEFMKTQTLRIIILI
jgi:hypothetical protein